MEERLRDDIYMKLYFLSPESYLNLKNPIYMKTVVPAKIFLT